MRFHRSKSCLSPRSRESGQTIILVAVLLVLLIGGFVGIATDYSNLWWHRQSARSAADAACQAGAADLLWYAQDSAHAKLSMGFDPSVTQRLTCSSSNPIPLCRYGMSPINPPPNDVTSRTLRANFANSNCPPDAARWGATHYCVQVTLQDQVPINFAKVLPGIPSSTTVGATATCGLTPVPMPVPIIVLDPTDPHTFALNGNPKVTITGGPQRSIQVNSSDAGGVSLGNNGSVDLSAAGPKGTGSDFGDFGVESKPSQVRVGTSGHWISPANPFPDPYATVAAPAKPSMGSVTFAPFGFNGCPDPAGCAEYSPGDYTTCNNGGKITVGSGGNQRPGCLEIPLKYTLKFLGWQSVRPYNVGDEIQNGNYIFRVITAGISAGTQPAWPPTIGNTVTESSGVTWENVGSLPNQVNTAIFDPGLYYVGAPGLKLDSNSTVRPAYIASDTTIRGAMFYFVGGNTVGVGLNTGSSSACTAANIGNATPNHCIVSYQPGGGVNLGVPSPPLQCPGGASNPSGLPSTVDGNILLGPCTLVAACTGASCGPKGQQYGDASGQYRGFLFFQDRGSQSSPSAGGGGQFLIAGLLYFHHAGSYNTHFSLSGGSKGGAYTIGNIVTDQISLGGNSKINLILTPSASYSILRPQLLQ